MKKLLTTIILLCFSVAANADIWFCTSETEATIIVSADQRSRNSYYENPQQEIIVDTDKGYRHAGLTNYYGVCKMSGIYLVCTDNSEGLGEGSFAIDTINNTFSYIDHIFGVRLTSRVGRCTKA